MSGRQDRQANVGFTLMELLVVVTIIAVLLAILLPIVNVSQTPPRRNMCSVNQKNLALALQNYAGSRKMFPGYRDTIPVNGVAQPIPVSWVTMILPQLDQRNIYDPIKLGNIIPSNPTALPYLELMGCPSDPQNQNLPSTSYVANCGLPDMNPFDAAQIPLNWSAGPESTFTFNIPADWSANGVFVSRWEPGVAQGKLPRVTLNSFYDGLTNTILLTESVDATVWNDTLSQSAGAQNGYMKLAPGVWNTPEIANGFIWTGEAKLKDNAGKNIALVINGPTSKTGAATEMSQCRPSSKHPGGVNVTYADGRCVFMNENIDYEVYSLLMTPDGRNATPNGEPFIETPKLPPQYQQYQVWRNKIISANDVP